MRALALSGGVGGAKLCFGLAQILRPDDLRIVVNTGDDEEFHGLYVCPDLDTVMYTLAELSNPHTGWGIRNETFATLSALDRLGQETWFGLGDQDLATHIVRTKMLREGKSLSDVTAHLCGRLGLEHPIIPMSDDPVRTTVSTDIGVLPFQTYFVRHGCEPTVSSLDFEGSQSAEISAKFSESLNSSDTLIFCPSNPYLSVAPILSVPGVRERIEGFEGTRLAVSPIVGGQALKGPAAKILEELGEDVSCVGVARQYVGLCDTFVIDEMDAELADDIRNLGMNVLVLNTIMNNNRDKIQLARYLLKAASESDGS
ncbi:MAG: 2-phospho-L-lactate transferase [Dehalococcoidia bacterium]|nr:2-phospho-L-lactate transferase [Dehalococcoidia bacterium]